jgi:hypothetical protein
MLTMASTVTMSAAIVTTTTDITTEVAARARRDRGSRAGPPTASHRRAREMPSDEGSF